MSSSKSLVSFLMFVSNLLLVQYMLIYIRMPHTVINGNFPVQSGIQRLSNLEWSLLPLEVFLCASCHFHQTHAETALLSWMEFSQVSWYSNLAFSARWTQTGLPVCLGWPFVADVRLAQACLTLALNNVLFECITTVTFHHQSHSHPDGHAA